MNEQKLQIYAKRSESYQYELDRLDKSNIKPTDKQLISRFHNALFAAKSGDLRVVKLSCQLRYICGWLKGLGIDKGLDELSHSEIVALGAHINKMKEKSPNTLADYRRAIKQFYRWFKKEDPRLIHKKRETRHATKTFYSYIEDDFKINYVTKKVDAKTIITEADIQLVVDKGCTTAKQKAFLMLLHETGCRIHEFLSLKIGSVEFLDDYAQVTVPPSKSEQRVIFITKSVPYINRWLDVHPYKDNDNAPLFVSESNLNRGKPLMYAGTKKLIKKCFRKAGVNKRHNPHWFRHSRASILATKFREPILCTHMGWGTGSRQVKTYVHVGEEELKHQFLEVNGLQKKEEQTSQPVKCATCETPNAPLERYCRKCVRPLSQEVIMQDKQVLDKEMNDAFNLMRKLAKDPKLMEQFSKFQEACQNKK